MKKLITILLVCLVTTLGMTTLFSQNESNNKTPVFNASTSVGFESEYNDKGRKVADNVAVTSVQVGVYDFFVGANGFWTLDDASTNKVELFTGYTLDDVLLGLDVTVGSDLNLFPDAGAGDLNYSIEPFVQLSFSDLILTPTATVYYDVNYEALTLEGVVQESFVTQNTVPYLGQLTLTPSLYVGWTHVGELTPKTVTVEDGYTYLGGALDVSAEVKGFTVSAGPRYVATDNAALELSNLSWGTSATYSF